MKIHDNLSEYKFERIRRNNLIYDFIDVKMNNKEETIQTFKVFLKTQIDLL